MLWANLMQRLAKDEVKEVITLGTDQIEKVTYDVKEEKGNFVSSVGKNGEELISILDLNAVALEK